jgi:arsenite methyltransferase
VIFCDISDAQLEECRRAVETRGLLARARFVISRAEDLAGIADESVDRITTRSVLIFVADKRSAFAAMYRVLRPGGRIVLREPIGRIMFPEPAERFWGYDLSAVENLAAKVKAAFAELEDPDFRAAMHNFDDRDLAEHAVRAGFERVHVECHIDIQPGSVMPATDVAKLLGSSPNPTAPTLGEAVDAALSEPERQRFVAALEYAMTRRDAIRRTAIAYVAATKAG